MAQGRLDAQFAELERHIAERQWEAAIALARAVGLNALAAGRPRVLLKAGAILERLEDHAFAARLLAAGGRMENPGSLPEWDGSSLAGRTLLVIQRIRHVGAAIRLGRLVPLAAERTKHCIVLAEPRLVPLFRRSFPGVDVRESGPNDGEAYAQADVVASYETLTQHLAATNAARIGGLAPLKPDADAVAKFRRRYGGPGPLIGICWHSTNEAKDLPALDDWADFMRPLNATYVSLQYGDVAADIEKMRALSGGRIVHDETVDSLNDLDLFAAQIAALDAVVTISNTGAHMTGALDVPMYVLLDDKNHLVWPIEGRATAWYPSATLIRKDNRRWPDVFAKLREELEPRFSAGRLRAR